MAAEYNYTWDQGADLTINLVYKTGASASDAAPVDLSSYAIRMDIRKENVDGVRVWTFNSEDIPNDAEASPDDVNRPADATGAGDNEAVLSSNGNIIINVPRSLTLPPSGAVYTQMQAGTFEFYYDVMMRNKTTNKQNKILKGTITVDKSSTLWA